MRTQKFIVSMASALVFAGAAQATVAPFNYYTFDSFTVAQTYTDSAAAWASPASSQPIFGASGARTVYAYDNAGPGSAASVSGGTATLSASGQGSSGLQYDGNAQDLTGYAFSFDLSLTGVLADAKIAMEFYSTGGVYAMYQVNYTVAGSYTVNMSTGFVEPVGSVDFTAITGFSLYLENGNSYANSLTVSNFGYVPAPGAAALIGLAGLVASRRRRN
jgi:hypothetical protein